MAYAAEAAFQALPLSAKLRACLATLDATSRVTNNRAETELRTNVSGVKEGITALYRELQQAQASALQAGPREQRVPLASLASPSSFGGAASFIRLGKSLRHTTTN
jgi:hypothetical protein